MSANCQNLESQLENLIESLRNDEIRKTTAICTRKAVILCQIMIYLRTAFGSDERITLKKVVQDEKKIIQLISNPKPLGIFLKGLNKLLSEEINKKRDIFGFRKEQTRKILQTCSKLIPSRSKLARNMLSKAQRLLDSIVLKQPRSIPEEQEIEKILVEARLRSSRFNEQIDKTRGAIKSFLSNHVGKDLASLLVQPNGANFDLIDHEMLEQLKRNNIRHFLKLSLS